jgi:hypothetical protein
MKVYLVQWGYYSSPDGGGETAAIYSTYEKALNHIRTDKPYKFESLEQLKTFNTHTPINKWTDGDYFVEIKEAFIDSPSLHMSKEEHEKIFTEIDEKYQLEDK